MRLHRLELSAFGPFADTVRIDLDAVGADGLFLLHGETGAGKTTLLDAVAFALYGRVPGARGEAKRLRCDRADATTPTSVTLELTVGDRRMEITRSPEYLRPKSRGTGTTKAKASVTLRWIGPPPSGLAPSNLTRAEEVGQVVLDLLGMSADQFFQVVLLPQGEFARFLRADTAEREVLLERLFDTGRFARLEEWFADRRKQARAALDAADVIVGQELARLVEAAGLGEEDGAPELDEAWLSATQSDLATRREQAAAAAGAARTARDAAAAECAAGEQRDASVVKLVELRTEQAAIEAARAAHDDLVAALAAAERAAPVVVAHAQAETAARAEAAAAQALCDARDRVPRIFRPELGIAGTHDADLDSGLFSLDEDGSAHIPDADADVLHRAAHGARDQAGLLGGLVGLSERLERDEAHRQDRRARESALSGELATVQSSLDLLPAEQAGAEAELAATRLRAAGKPDRDAAVQAATVVHRAAAAIPRLTAALSDADAARQAAVDEHQRARELRQDLVERRIAGMAAELAGQLVDGAPCGVCGSVTHPAPAQHTADPVDAAAVAAAREGETTKERARVDAESRLSAAQDALTAATTAAAGRDRDAAHAELDRALAAQRESADAAEREPILVDAVHALATRAAEVGDRRTAIMAEMQGIRTELESLDRSLLAQREQLADATAGYPSVAARRDHLLAVADLLDAWAAAAESHARARQAARLAAQQRDKAVADSGFTELAGALAAAELDIPAARDEVRRFDERLLVVSTRLADPALDLDGPIERVDVAALRARSDAAVRHAEQAAAAALETDRRCERVAAAGERWCAAWSARAPLAVAAERTGALAEVIAGRGQNTKALSLRTYVLAAKLQQVAAVAGERLVRMSAGRYSFVYSDERESRGRSGGLGLDIMDGFSGKVRPAKTLSGGESFLASLALALGLADVVAAESGGRMLDTIFIDEGFGSLDSDTLDLVMATLDELRAGGRVVGVVSHVDEMCQRIPTRLRVRKTIRGSAVELTASSLG